MLCAGLLAGADAAGLLVEADGLLVLAGADGFAVVVFVLLVTGLVSLVLSSVLLDNLDDDRIALLHLLQRIRHLPGDNRLTKILRKKRMQCIAE